MSIIQERCRDCDREFEITEREQDFYKEKEWSLPKRCAGCRKLNKQKKFNEQRS